ncbi:hypothetical protein [Streptomyces sp. NPDC097619]|uniref:hypothetical protein n=1 Tax=Streptomyces sp. NPDC097619 TaxID=3157228 RepID=UPI00331FD9E4
MLAGLLLSGCAEGSPTGPKPSGGPSGTTGAPTATVAPPSAFASASPSSSVTPTGSGARTPGPSAEPTAPAGSDPALGAGLQPLWPFTSLARAREWQRSYRDGGHQPWHLDAEQTALAFVRDFLGFRELDRVASQRVSGRHARIGIGPSAPEEARRSTAAVVHLVRYGTGADAPWEVVGTDDTTFSLTAPAYGAAARSPLRVGGRITGVDESIRVEVRGPSSPRPLGTACCVPGGGTRQPWTATVAYSGATDPVLTVVASTGGHVNEVERFTVTAVRPR